MTAQQRGAHTAVPQQAAAGPWLPPAQPWCACCAWLAGECWTKAVAFSSNLGFPGSRVSVLADRGQGPWDIFLAEVPLLVF
ncbi:hypothetical protein HaLaN_18519 [Haematococcus lacustris]|uniref:Uncharacterized protein n=1 Tax=Haematococcus lacustris TaxID=44745 RepID=A0A699ZR28_HAELA|nr:hypothetical protein HaLaN_18519 [Haematococcus lacustris]